MACAHPIPARRGADGGVIILHRQDVTSPFYHSLMLSGEYLALPCGSCLGCQMSRAREWAFRCQLEFNEHEATCWTTLTYDDDHLPPTLQKRHLSAFLKRLRSRVLPLRLRFFASGEYGERKQRPHYHAILFGVSDSPDIAAAWPHGAVKTFPLSPALIAYTAGYCAKKVGHSKQAEERLDPSTGELYLFQPPFLLMSRRPGIGGAARAYTGSWRDHAIYSQHPIPVPRFLHNAWQKSATEAQQLTLKNERLSGLKALNRYHLNAQEQINRASLQLQSEKRTL